MPKKPTTRFWDPHKLDVDLKSVNPPDSKGEQRRVGTIPPEDVKEATRSYKVQTILGQGSLPQDKK